MSGERSACPYPFERDEPAEPARLLAATRAQRPVCPVTLPSGDPAQLVTRHRDAVRVWTDPAFSLARRHQPDAPSFSRSPTVPTRGNLLNLDPPDHTRLRRVAARSFSRRRVESLRADIEQVTGSLLGQMAASGPPVDLIPSLCAPLPITVLGAVFGVPERDRAAFAGWANAVLEITASTKIERLAAWHALGSYLARLVETKRDAPASDLLSDLATALTTSEAVNLTVQILVAGYESTLYQLAIFSYVLLSSPATWAELVADRTQIPTVVEELLRLHPPADASVIRVATTDVELGGTTIPAGTGVLIDFAAVNRDPEVFSAPDELDVRRTETGHLTYGHGAHYCLGAALARAELQIAVTGLVRHFPSLRLAVDPAEIEWRPASRIVQGPTTLPVEWDQ